MSVLTSTGLAHLVSKIQEIFAPLASPVFTGAPEAPTAAKGTNTDQIATTAFVKRAVDSAISNTAIDSMLFDIENTVDRLETAQSSYGIYRTSLGLYESWGRIPKENLYDFSNDQDIISNADRLAMDRDSLMMIAQGFFGKTKSEIENKLKITIDGKKFFGTTNGLQNGTYGNIKDKNYNVCIVEFFDLYKSGKSFLFNPSEIHISSKWLSGTYTSANDTEWGDLRYFYSNQIIHPNPYNSGTQSYSTKVKCRFNVDENDRVNYVKIFILRQKCDINATGTAIAKWYTNVSTDREYVQDLDITLEMDSSGNISAYLSSNNTALTLPEQEVFLPLNYCVFFKKGETTTPGDVIALDISAATEQYVKSSSTNRLVVGVHSEDYALIIGGESGLQPETNMENYIPVAVVGFAYVKFTGTATKGCYVVASNTSGVARAYDSTNDSPLDVFGILVEEDNETGTRQLLMKLK